MEDLSYRNLLERMRKWYKTIGKVYCSCLQDYVIFNSKGFYHLRYKSSGTERTVDEQVSRLKLLPFVISLLKRTKRVYEYRISDDCKVRSWAFQERINGNNMRVVLKQKSNGHVIYFSVMRIGSQKDHQSR